MNESDSDEWSFSDSESVSSIFTPFEPKTSSNLFKTTPVSAQQLISPRPTRKRRRSSLTLSSKRKRKRITKNNKQYVCTERILQNPKVNDSKFAGLLAELVPHFQSQFSKISAKNFRSLAEFTTCWINFQKYVLSFCTPLQRDEFNSFYFKTSKMATKTFKQHTGNSVVKFGRNTKVACYMMKKSLTPGNYMPFDSCCNSKLTDFFTLDTAQSYLMWQNLQKLSPPFQTIFWDLVDKFAPAKFYIQTQLQTAFVDTFSLDVASSPQYLATLRRFAKFVNETRHFPVSNKDAQFSYALNCLKTCSQFSYTLIQGWLLRQMARGLAFTTLRTYCFHLSWFQQPNERRYSKSQEFKRFLIHSVSRFFLDNQDHGSDPMDQETLTAFWKILDTSSFTEAQYDKRGFTWILQLALRVTEAIHNQWSHIDFNQNNVGVVQKIPNAKNQKKYGKTYLLALQATHDEFCPVTCLRYLAKHGTSQFVFYNRIKNRGWTSRAINKRFQFYIKQLPLNLRKNKKFTVYSMRSTFACSLSQANVDINLIQAFMRQKCTTSTSTYVQKAFPHISFANLLASTKNTDSENFSNTYKSNLKTTRR